MVRLVVVDIYGLGRANGLVAEYITYLLYVYVILRLLSIILWLCSNIHNNHA